MSHRNRDHRRWSIGIGIVIMCIIALAIPGGMGHAAGTYAVDTTTDPATGSGTASNCQPGHTAGTCALRDAIAAAIADTGATVTVPSGTYTLNHGDPADPIQSSGILISQPISLIGAGSASVIIQAATTAPPPVSVDDSFTPYYRVFEITGGPTAIRGVTIRFGDPSGSCTGGGVKVTGVAAAITESVITQNVTCQDGGGIQVFGTGSSLTVDRSTISANTSNGYSGGIDGGTSSGLIIVRNSTLTGNTANGNAGGAITTGPGGVQLLNTTITQNAATPNGTGGGVALLSSLTMQNTIIAGNTNGYDPVPSPDIDNEGGTFTSNGNNLIGVGDATDAPITFQQSDQHGTAAMPLDPKLGMLTDNGGPTPTQALLMGSPAIGQGSTAACNTLIAFGVTGPVDQRGASRSTSCSIGAFELGGVQTTTSLAANLLSLTYGQTETLTATVKGVLGGTPADGTVAFKDGGTVIANCTAQPISAGTATCMTTALTAVGSPHMLTAVYAPGTNYATSTSTPAVSVSVMPAPVTVTADAKSRSYGATNPLLTFTTVGLVNNDMATTAFTGALTTTATTTSPVAGSPYAITQGTLLAPNYTISFIAGSLTITPATTTTTLIGAPNPATVGQSVTFTATVISAGGTPTGSVTFTDTTNPASSVSLGSPVTVNGMGIATLTTSTLTPGPHTISAVYSGNGNFSGSSATSFMQSVTALSPVILSPTMLPAGTVNTAYPATTIIATGGTGGPYTFAFAPSLPPGITGMQATGTTFVLNGTPTMSGVFTFTVSATDMAMPANKGTQTYILTVSAAMPPTVTSLTLGAPTGAGSGNMGTGTNPILKPGGSLTLSLTGTFSDNSTGPVSGVIFTSSDPTKVAVDPRTGVITPLAPTTTPVTITATAPNGVMTTISVTVTTVTTGGLTNPNPAPMSHASGAMVGATSVAAPTRHADTATVPPAPRSH